VINTIKVEMGFVQVTERLEILFFIFYFLFLFFIFYFLFFIFYFLFFIFYFLFFFKRERERRLAAVSCFFWRGMLFCRRGYNQADVVRCRHVSSRERKKKITKNLLKT
jgi:hypothetical protein